MCWAICVVGEFSITWQTLPFALNVSSHSFLGVAIGAVPVAALTVVEWVLARGVEHPYQEALTTLSAASTWRRWAANTVMGIFLVLLLVGNIQTIRLLGYAREESAKLHRIYENRSQERPTADSAPAEPEVNYQIINKAIMAVSVAVVVDGALLLLLGMHDLDKFGRRLNARFRVTVYHRWSEKAEKVLSEAQPVENAWTKVWEEREKRGEIIEEEFRRQHLVKLQEVLDRKPPIAAHVSIEAMVDEILMRGLNENGKTGKVM